MSEGGKDTPLFTRRNVLVGFAATVATILSWKKLSPEYQAAQKIYQEPIDDFLYTIQTGDVEGPVAVREKPSPLAPELGRAPAQEVVELRKIRGAQFPQHPKHNIEIDGEPYGVWFRGKFKTVDGKIVEGNFPGIYATVLDKTPISQETSQQK